MPALTATLSPVRSFTIGTSSRMRCIVRSSGPRTASTMQNSDAPSAAVSWAAASTSSVSRNGVAFTGVSKADDCEQKWQSSGHPPVFADRMPSTSTCGPHHARRTWCASAASAGTDSSGTRASVASWSPSSSRRSSRSARSAAGIACRASSAPRGSISWTRPRRPLNVTCSISSASHEVGHLPQVVGVAAHEHRGHRNLPPAGVELLAHLLDGADERHVLDQLERHGADRLVLLPGEEEVLDLFDLLGVTHAGEQVGVEVDLASAHATDVEAERHADHVGGRVHVVVDDDLDHVRDLEVVSGAAGAGPGEPLVEALPVVLVELR